MFRVAPWPRVLYEPGGIAVSWDLICVASTDVEPSDFPSKYEDFPYDGRPPFLDVKKYTRQDHPGWFDWFDHGSLLPDDSLGGLDRRPELAPLVAACQVAIVVTCELSDATDLGFVQATWATARWYLEAGALAVVDSATNRWYTAAEILGLDPYRAFSVRREVQLYSELLANPPNTSVLCTRGLRKLGREELVTVISDVDATQLSFAKYMFEGIAGECAHGRVLRAGDHAVFEGRRYELEAYEVDVQGPDMQLDGDPLFVAFT